MEKKNVHRPLKVVQDWNLTETLGQGSMGKVKLAVNGDLRMACKIVPKPLKEVSEDYQLLISDFNLPTVPGTSRKHQDNNRIIREIALSLSLSHPNIPQLKHVIVTKHHYYLFYELVKGAQLLDFIISHGKIKERLSKRFIWQILSAIHYCHSNSIVHRDLKIENVLIEKTGQIKLIDFGLANLYSLNSQLDTFCGSLYFAAPELLSAKKYVGPEIDVWSLGVILFVLICGKVPFDDANLAQLHSKIKSGHVEYPSFLSDEARDLIGKMLTVDPSKRITLKEIEAHPWFPKDMFPNPLPTFRFRPVHAPYDEAVLQSLLIFGFGKDDTVAKELNHALLDDFAKNPSVPSPILSMYNLIHDRLHDSQGPKRTHPITANGTSPKTGRTKADYIIGPDSKLSPRSPGSTKEDFIYTDPSASSSEKRQGIIPRISIDAQTFQETISKKQSMRESSHFINGFKWLTQSFRPSAKETVYNESHSSSATGSRPSASSRDYSKNMSRGTLNSVGGQSTNGFDYFNKGNYAHSTYSKSETPEGGIFSAIKNIFTKKGDSELKTMSKKSSRASVKTLAKSQVNLKEIDQEFRKIKLGNERVFFTEAFISADVLMQPSLVLRSSLANFFSMPGIMYKSTVKDETFHVSRDRVQFTIDVVQIPTTQYYGLRFNRLAGDQKEYAAICNDILFELQFSRS